MTDFKNTSSKTMLHSKIESEEFKRHSLDKYQKILMEYFDECFYCCESLKNKSIHVDHFIPWSYIYEDELWNLVLACGKCNCDKSDSLPYPEYIDKLVKRNFDYYNKIEDLRKSVKLLDIENKQEKAIKKYYQNCFDYGFTKKVLECKRDVVSDFHPS
jgi:CRISPR/Cas system Type II protein with McrA/HNH and RuvC-like nuclease domain